MSTAVYAVVTESSGFGGPETSQEEILPEDTTTEKTVIPESTMETLPRTEVSETVVTGTTVSKATVSETTVPETTTPKSTDSETAVPESIMPMAETQPTEKAEPIVNLQKICTEWFLSNESTDVITIWKKWDEEGNLLIALRNQSDEVLCTFLYEGGPAYYEEGWTLCDEYLEEITTRDIIDLSFVAYREVGGGNQENVQAQAFVILNRVKSQCFGDSIRSVITKKGQYSCKNRVLERKLKNDRYTEEEDLEKCFRQILLVLAGEVIEEVPENVVYAAAFKQGSGVWKIIDGTYYCYQ